MLCIHLNTKHQCLYSLFPFPYLPQEGDTSLSSSSPFSAPNCTFGAIVTKQAPTLPRQTVWLLPPRKTPGLHPISFLYVFRYNSEQGPPGHYDDCIPCLCSLRSLSPPPLTQGRGKARPQALEPDILVLHSGSAMYYPYDLGKVIEPPFASVSLFEKWG